MAETIEQLRHEVTRGQAQRYDPSTGHTYLKPVDHQDIAGPIVMLVDYIAKLEARIAALEAGR